MSFNNFSNQYIKYLNLNPCNNIIYNPIKKYIINLSDIKNNKNEKYPINDSIQEFPGNKNDNYLKTENQLFSSINNFKNIIYPNNNTSRCIEPYKKKYVLFKPKFQTNDKSRQKLNITSNSLKRVLDSISKENYCGYRNINNNQLNNTNDLSDFRQFENNSINNIYLSSRNYNPRKSEKNIGYLKKKVKIHLLKNDSASDVYKLFRRNSEKGINIIDSYNKKYTKILLILLEKIFKNYLLKYQFIFINNLKKYKITRKKFDKIRINKLIFSNSNCMTERFYGTLKNNKGEMKNKNKRENLNAHKLEKEKNSRNILNLSATLRNKSKLYITKTIEGRKNLKIEKKPKETSNKYIIDNSINKKINTINNPNYKRIGGSSNRCFFVNKQKPMIIEGKNKKKIKDLLMSSNN